MPAVRDLYEVLGVPRDAGEDEIKRAYRRKARELHPDSGGDEESFKELTAAYEVLRNASMRSNYDRFGDPRGAGGAGDLFGGFGDLSDLIASFFGDGGGMGRRDSGAGRDAVVEVSLTLEEAATGAQREVEATLLRTCARCDGRGAARGTTPVTCRTCGGRGVVQRVRQSVFGQMLSSGACPDCGGSGSIVAHPCDACRGEGRVRTTEALQIDVPAGIDDGRRLRRRGMGESGRRGASPGDLHIRVRVAPHEVFTRDGDDLHCELRLGLVAAALGTHLDVPTLDGDAEVDVPAGTQFGDVLTLRRRGMPRLGGSGVQRGDLHIHCRVETPRNLSDDERDLLRDFGERRGERVAGGDQRGLFGRLREAFGG